MHTTCVNSKDNAKSNESDHIFVIRENTRLKHRCPYYLGYTRGIIPCFTNTQCLAYAFNANLIGL